MQGEQLNQTEVTERGLLGDRAYALRDKSEAALRIERELPRYA